METKIIYTWHYFPLVDCYDYYFSVVRLLLKKQKGIEKREKRAIRCDMLGFYFINACTIAFAFKAFKSVYVCPVPTKTIGWPVMYVIEMAAPTYFREINQIKLVLIEDCTEMSFN